MVSGRPPAQWGLLGHPSSSCCDALLKLTETLSPDDSRLHPNLSAVSSSSFERYSFYTNGIKDFYYLYKFLPSACHLNEPDCGVEVKFNSIKVRLGCDDPQTDHKGFDPRSCRHDYSLVFAAVVFWLSYLLRSLQIVFPWTSTQGKRKLWLRVSLVSREPS